MAHCLPHWDNLGSKESSVVFFPISFFNVQNAESDSKFFYQSQKCDGILKMATRIFNQINTELFSLKYFGSRWQRRQVGGVTLKCQLKNCVFRQIFEKFSSRQ